MATVSNKPRGYFDFLLAIDCETTGLSYNANNPAEGHQPLSWGIIVVDANTLKPIEDLYVEIKWNQESKERRKQDPSYGKSAEAIHGLTMSYLESNGITEEEAVKKIANLIIKYWGPSNNIRTLGHNVHTFDMPFLRDMFARHQIQLSFGNRHVDTSSVGFCTFGTYNSDDLFEIVGCEKRDKHNALDDAYMSLKAARVIKTLFKHTLEH